MADPLSVISAIVGLSHLGMKLKMLLDDKYLCMVGAPAQIRTLDANLTSFCELMRQIRELSEEPDPIPSSSDDPKSSTSSAMAAARAEQRQKTKLNLAPVLRGCVVTLEALQDLLTRHADAVTSKSRGLKAFASFKWALNEKELAGLMNDLERYKSSIDIAVNYLTFLQSQELAEGQQRIEDGVESITQTNNAIYEKQIEMMKNLESRFESFHTLIESNRDSKSPRSLRSDSDNWSVSSGSSSTTAVLYKYAERMESVIRDPSNTIFTSATPQTPLSELDTYFNSRLPENSFPTLPTPLQVATKTHRLSSGFPYPWLLERYQISAHDWLLFTQSIISRWSLTTVDEAIANAAALGTAMVPGGILVSLPVRKAVLKARSNYKIRKGLRGKGSSEEGEEGVESTGELQGVLDRWNSDFFGPRGLVVDVRLPGKGGVNSEEGEGGCMVDKDGFCKEVEERLKAADAEAAAAKEKDGQMIVKKVNGEEDEEEEEEEYYLWDKWEKFSLMVKDTYAQELVRSDERDFNSNCRIVLSPVS